MGGDAGMVVVMMGFGMIGLGILAWQQGWLKAGSEEKKTTSYAYTQDAAQWWPSEKSGEYTCPTATGVNTTGNTGDFGNWCIFNDDSSAQKHCSSDSSCLGYLKMPGSYIQAVKKTPNAGSGGQQAVYMRKVSS